MSARGWQNIPLAEKGQKEMKWVKSRTEKRVRGKRVHKLSALVLSKSAK